MIIKSGNFLAFCQRFENCALLSCDVTQNGGEVSHQISTMADLHGAWVWLLQKAWKNWWKTIMIRIKCNNFCSGMFYISTKNQIGKESDFVTQHLTVWLSRLWTFTQLFTHNIHVLPSFSNFVTIVCTGLCSSPICERGTRKLWPWIRNVQSKNTSTLTWIITLVHGRYKGRLACGSTEYVSESILTEKVRQPPTLPLWFGKIAKSFLQSVLLV